MKVIQYSRYIIILYFISLAVLFNSCSTQNPPSHNTQKLQFKNVSPSVEDKIYTPSFIKTETDTSLLLNLPSGIRAILEDSHGNIWFGSHQDGVCFFDGKKLNYFTIEDGLSNNQVRSIFEDSKGIIWFECGEGISSYDGKKITTHIDVIKNYNSKKEWKAGKNDLWFKADPAVGHSQLEGNSGVYRYDGNQLSYHSFPTTSTDGNNFTVSVSTPFVKGKNGMFWFGTYGAVIGYDGKSLPPSLLLNNHFQTSFTIIDDKSLGFDPGFLHVRSLFEDSKGNLWIGNNGIGVLIYDGKTTINFSEKKGLISKNSLRSGGFRSPPGSLEHVFAIREDRHGNMWFGDRDTGAWKYDGKTMKNYTAKDGLTCTHIWQIYNTKNGKLWFAMNDGNVLEFNGESFERVF